MPPLDTDWENKRGFVIGWGTQFFGGPYSNILMEVSVPIWSHEECQAAYNQRIHDTVLCAGSSEGGQDSCQVNSRKLNF